MLKRVELHFFKNYGPRTVVNINSEQDHCFSVVVGRNGSGKSALIDGIIWCLFQRRASTIRSKNTKNLVNKSSPKGTMHVIVDILHAELQ
jgi:chromosome segregation ATPase